MSGQAYVIPAADLVGLAPELILTGAGVLLLLLDAFARGVRRWSTPGATVATLAAAWAAWTWVPYGESFGGLLASDGITLAVSLVVLLAGLLTLLASHAYLLRERLPVAEYHALLLWCAAGMLLMIRSRELLTVFVSLELLSICLYALAGFHRRLQVSTEAALKYFLMGAFVSAFVLLGIGLVYGETGSTRLEAIGPALAAGSPMMAFGVLLLISGFAFKMSLVPFHAWSPDAYQGAPSPFVAFLSVAPKAAAAVVLVRLVEAALPAADRWGDLVAVLAVLSMVVGNLLALAQRDLKRMLAYSGIAHMGYLLVPLVGWTPAAWEAVVVYLLAYALMNAGAFAIVTMLYAEPGEQHLISDLSGWGYRFPLLGLCLTVAMLSLGGIPPTFGFIGKYLIFVQAIDQGHLGLAVVVVATSLVGVYYYLRVIYTLYMRPEVKRPEGLAIDGWGRTAAVLAAAGILVLGLLPGGVLDWLRRAVELLAS